ncbi:MAG: hypothetical protein HY863_04885 [Chloroflexi bacterium]|nr:hypothetical protein [Chloroflexota bacterium]
MARTKFLNVVISVMVMVSMMFGGNYTNASAQQRASTPPQGKTKAQKPPLPPTGQPPTPVQRRMTPAERQAAADRAKALGQLPGVAALQLPGSKANKPVSANLPDSSVVPHYFGPYANYANSPMPKGSITSITVDDGGSGYSATPVVYVLDAYGTGMDATATATVVGGVITGITVDTSGSDYTAPIVVIEDATGTGAAATPILGSLTGGIRKFVDALPGLGAGGANLLGNYIPVGVPDVVTYGPDFVAAHPHPDARPSHYYEIALVQYTQQLHSDLPPTTLRGYVQLETAVVTGAHVQLYYPDGSPIYYPGTATPVYAVDQPRYLGPTIVAASDTPVRIKFYNFLPTGEGGDLFIPTDTTVMGAGEGPKDALGADCDPMLAVCEMYTQNRATLHLHGGLVPWISDGTPHQWITPAGEVTQYPKGVSVQNVPDMPDPGDGAQTFYYNNAQGARLMFYHDHAYGITRLNVYAGEAAGYVITDQVEADLIAGTNITGVNPLGLSYLPGVGTPLVLQDKSFVDATTIGAQDPTWKWGTGAPDISGRKEPKTGDLWLPSVYMPIQNPNDLAGGNAFGRWQYGPWFNPPTANIENGPMANPYYDPGCDNATTWCEPQFQPSMPTPSMGMEAYMDTSMVNGAVYPYMEVDPTTVRFRVLNAANDRFYNLQMYVAVDALDQPCDVATNPAPAAEASGVVCTEVKMVPATATAGFPALWPNDGRAGGAPDPALAGPEWIQIGTEGGFLPAPVVIPQQPITWQGNPGFFNVGNVLDHSLLLGNAERADVLVDFSAYAGKTLILYNDAPTAFPALDPRYDYYSGNPSQMDSGGAPTTQRGYGPNTRTVMQIRVKNIAPSAAYDVAALEAVFAKDIASGKAGVFEAAHPGETPIIPQAAYNSAYDATFPSDALSQYVQIGEWEKTFTPIGSTTPVTITFETKAIHDEMGGVYDTVFGRMSGMLGLDIPQPNSLNQNIILSGYASPPVDVLQDTTATQIGVLGDGTQIWKIMHNGVDTHPIHWHMFNLQLINRVGWDGLLMPPDANELGWKETIRINPLEDTIVAMRPKKAAQPFEVPNSIRPIDPTKPIGVALDRGMQGILTPDMFQTNALNHMINYGWEYVWHCHILSHEEMDMMHSMAVAVTPTAPSNLTASDGPTGVDLTWTDNSTNETEFTLQRTSGGVVTNIKVPSLTGPQTGDLISYTDTTAPVGSAYSYVVLATNVVGDTFIYNPAPGARNFPTKVVSSNPSNIAANMVSVASIVRASVDPTSATTVDFTVTFTNAVILDTVGFTDFALTGTVTAPTITAIVGAGTTYTVTADTGTGNGTLRLDMTNVLLGGPFTTGEFYTIERTPPLAASILRASANPASTNGVNFTVTFDKVVTGVDAADFLPVTTGVFTVAPAVKSVTGAGTTYTVTVGDYKSNNGTLGLNLVDDDSIVDIAAIPLGGSGPINGDLTGEVYSIDNMAPTVVSSVRASANPSSAASVAFTVTFSEPVTGVDKFDFSLNPTVTGASVTSVAGAGTTRTVTVSTGSASGTIRLNVLDNDSIVDGLFTPLNGLKTGTTFSAGESYTVDKVPPSVVSIVRASANPSGSAAVSFTVTFSEVVTGVDRFDFSVVNAGTTVTGASITTVGGTGTTRLVTVNTGTGSGTLHLDLIDNDTIKDASLLPLGGSGLLNGDYLLGETYSIDKTPPTVVSIVRASANPTGAASVNFTVTFSKSVTGVDVTDFSAANAGTTVTGASVTSVTGTGLTRTVAVNTGTGSGTLRLDLIDNDSIVDAVGNPLGDVGLGNGDYLLGESYTVDKTPPTVISIVRRTGFTDPNRGNSVEFTVTFSETVIGVDRFDFTVANAGTTVIGAAVTSVNGTGATRTVVVSTGTGDGTLRLDLIDNDTIRDSYTNPLGGVGLVNGDFTAGQSFTIDKTVPAVVSIVRGSADPTSAASVNFIVTFSEIVTGVNGSDFTVLNAGTTVTGASVTVVGGTGTTYTVTVNTGTGSGTLRLDLIDNDSIRDTATNRLGGTGLVNGDFTTGQFYTIDRTPPAVVSIVRASADPTSASVVDFTVTFSEAVTGVNSSDFSLGMTGLLSGTLITGVAGTGTTYTITVDTGTGSGTLHLDLIDNDSIVDALSNPLGGAGLVNGDFTTGETYTIDRTTPLVVSIVRASADPAASASLVDFTVTFSETVTGVDGLDFSLINAGTTVTGASITSVAGTGTTYTITVDTGAGPGTLHLDLIDDDSIMDAFSNPLGGAGLGNGDFTTGETYNVL